MHMRTRVHQTMVTEPSKTIYFRGHFIYNMVVHWIAIPLIGIAFFIVKFS